MRHTLTILTVLLVAVGFLAPIAWAAAAVTGFLALASRPPGFRPDGKKKTGGLLGALFDSIEIAARMRDCPYCKQKVPKEATKCPHCQEWLPQD